MMQLAREICIRTAAAAVTMTCHGNSVDFLDRREDPNKVWTLSDSQVLSNLGLSSSFVSCSKLPVA